MHEPPERLIVPSDRADAKPIQLAVKKALEVCAAAQRSCDLVLLLPTLRQLEYPVFHEALTPQVCAVLRKKRRLDLRQGVQMLLATERTFRDSASADVVVAIYPSSKALDMLDTARVGLALIVVPSSMEGIQEWCRTWDAQVMGREHPEPQRLIENPLLEEALFSITARVNLSTGVAHASDKACAVRAFEILRDAGQMTATREDIRGWAVRHDWRPRDADELAGLAQAVAEGRRPRTTARAGWREDILDCWQERVRERQADDPD